MQQAKFQSSLGGELEVDIDIKAPAKNFLQMLVGTPRDVPKATPNNIKGCELGEGECGKVGSVIVWHYVLDGQPKMMKDRIEVLDYEKNLVVARVFEGDIMKEFKTFLVTVQATPKQRGHGSVVKFHITYERLDEKVARPVKMLEMFAKISKDMDGMLSS